MIGNLDFNSIMMYGAFDFAKNKNIPVITLKGSEQTYSNNAEKLSTSDRAYINRFYLPYIARSDIYAELAPVVYDANNNVLTPNERLNLQARLNNGNPYPPNCCRIPNSHTNL